MRPPFAIIALLSNLYCRPLGRRNTLLPVNWRETAEHAVARFFVGLVVGFGLCVLLVPLVFGPAAAPPFGMGSARASRLGWLDFCNRFGR